MSHERPGRYQRSFSGLVGAMLVLILFVAAFVVFRAFVRDDPEVDAPALDYITPARFARETADFPILAPASVPDGWKATSVEFVQQPEQEWRVGFLTDEEEYIGIEQAQRPIPDMVEDFVDEEAVQGEDVTIEGEQWQSWTDEGGDLAFALEADGVTSLVVGTVPRAQLVAFVESMR